MAIESLPFAYDNIISLTIWYIVYGSIIGDSNCSENIQKGFTLRHFKDTGTVSVQCHCHQLPKDTSKVVSINLNCKFSTSESHPVASLYPDGELFEFLSVVRSVYSDDMYWHL